MLKKMTLLAGMALAAIALAVPTSASALEWTDEGSSFFGTVEDTFSGKLFFGNTEVAATKFGCIVHADLEAEGIFTTGALTSYERTISTCEGAGAFLGCVLTESRITELPADLSIVGGNSLTMTPPGISPIVLHTFFDGACPISKVALTVWDLKLAGSNGDLTDLTISGSAVAHVTPREGSESTSTVEVWGTWASQTDTITIG